MDDEKQEVFEYLDELRESSVTNMFGASPFLISRFGFDRKKARELLQEWMKTFETRHPV